MNAFSIGQRCFLILTALAVTSCGGSGGTDGPDPRPPVNTLKATPTILLALSNEQSCDELKDYVADSIAELMLQSGFVPCLGCALMTTGIDAVPPGTAASSETFDAFTGTNNQESGVDELDIVEADVNGNLYTIDGQNVVIANGLPPQNLREIANIEFGNAGWVHGLLLDNDNQRLVVATSLIGVEPAASAIIAPEFWGTPQVELYFYDVSDPANPVLLRQLLMDGFEIAARRIDSRVHLVTHFAPNIPTEILDDATLIDLLEQYRDAVNNDRTDDITALSNQVRGRVRTLVAALDAGTFLPGLWSKDPNGNYVSIPNPNCAVEKPDVSLSYALTSITSVDTDGGNIASTSIANNAWNVYASESNLYLTQPSYGWWWDPHQRQETAIYKFEIGAGAAQFRAFGKVTGIASTSFQLSEHDGHLRVATNRDEWFPDGTTRETDNNLYVLADDGAGTLGVTGAVEGFGRDEFIFSARFLGTRGFVVTFRQIDPLFAFDLTDPSNPQLAGELEIEGVSTYMHPLGDDHLLTIGFDGDDQGLNFRYRLQIYDVRDLSSPMLAHSLVPDFDAENFAWTRAIWDHHAFNYFRDGGVLTIPVQYHSSDFEQHFSGFAAYSIDINAGISELGQLDHSDMAKGRYCPDPSASNDDSICEHGWYLEAADPRRAVSALVNNETIVYTFSDVAIKASATSDFSTEIAVLPLDYPNQYWWWIAPQ